MMFRFVSFSLLALTCATLFAEDPPPPAPVADLVAIVAPKEVTGTGKRADPFVFTASTKCMLRLTGATSGTFDWDLEDGPASAEAIDRAVIFALEPGTYVIVVHGDGIYAKCWCEIKGSGPAPPAPVANLAARTRAALTGPEAKADAAKLAGMLESLADALEAGRYSTMKEYVAAHKTAQQAVQWPTGRYPDLPDIIRTASPPADETTPVTQEMRAAFVRDLRIISTAAKGVANG